MIQVVLFLITVALIAAGFVWLADRPGDVVVTWLGYHIETSVMVMLLAVAALIVIGVMFWSVARAIWRSPEQVSLFFRHRRAMKGYLAISRGLVAIGSGDTRLARRSADEAARLSPGDPLTLLLTAQSAQLAGDRIGAERAFHEMTRHEQTKLLGLRGLYIEAQRRNDMVTARRFAEQAAETDPALTWAGQAVLDDRCAQGDWSGALKSLDAMRASLDKQDYRRKRAVLLTAQALALEDSDRDAARLAALDAVKLAPGLVPAAAFAGRRLAEAGDQRRAGKVLIAAWRLNPHPDIAEAYADLRPGDTARARLTRMQTLAGKSSEEPNAVREGAIAVARAAIDAREFKIARDALAPYLNAPSKRVATLMAEIEETEHGDEGRVREWLGRAMRAAPDPVWTADGVVSDRWLPVSPRGRLDGYEWRVPLAEIGMTHPVVDAPPPPLPEIKPVAQVPEPIEIKAVAPSEAPKAESPKPEPVAKPSKPAPKPVTKPVVAEPVMPLIQVPDDPGPDAGLDPDPQAEKPLPGDGWPRGGKLFR
ncbi:MAG TPA: heme biosynthesis HemY N-terminal domain-containing protein [Pseudolabrys sp.]|nr:heme biosynthesis HemY N-terminal domain-containing protein [Pseudolabrys sp.]